MSMSQEEIEALMSGADEIESDETTEEEVSVLEDETESEETSETDIDDILAGIDGIVDDEPEVKAEPEPVQKKASPSKVKEDTIETVLEEGQYPLPVRSENKVVNQLNEVADDSEKKASQIFDALSFILDENSEIQSYNKKMGEFIEKQAELLKSLSIKFPNIQVFDENLELAKELTQTSKDISDKVDGENNKIFEAMELMQFHDINRQKIERVMSVIKKLTNYLNGIFEDDSNKPEVQIAKHISGDSSETVDDNDLESLIAEFSN